MYLYANGSGLSGTYCGSDWVRNWHAPDKVKAVRQFVCFVGYYRRLVKDFVWTDHQQTAFDALKACVLSAPILGLPTKRMNDFF